MNLFPETFPPRTHGGGKLTNFANLDSEVLFTHILPTVNGLVRQYQKGIYDPELALKAFQRVADAAALIYEHDYGDREAAEKRRITTFTRAEREDAGGQLFILNAYMVEDGIRAAQKRSGIKHG